MPLYLEDDEELYPRPDQEEDDDQSFDVGDPTKLPPAPAVGSSAPKPTPELQRLISGSPSPLPASDAPVNKSAEAARQKYVDVVSSRPAVPKPKWWQQALSGVAGGLAGWSNAAGRTRRPIDIQQLGQNINAPGYGRELANWQSKVQAADAGKTAAEENQSAWWKNRQMQTEEERRGAEEERNRATAEWERKRNDTMLERSKIQDARDRDETLLKRPDAFTIQESERGSVPQGWQVTPSSQQGVLIATPPPFMKLPPELAPYSAGAKAGEIVPYSRYKAAQDAAAKSQVQSEKPVAEKMDATRLAIIAAGGNPDDPKSITQEVAKRAISQQKQGVAVQLTPEATDFWARFAGTTGQLPSLGMGQAGATARGQILNRAPELAGGDVAANKATYHADTTSLANMQKMRDAVVSFEKTAGANLDIFLNQAKRIVDSGSPLANRPIRAINRNLLGDTDLAAYDAARRVAMNEIAKVTSNPTLSGQLSDSARHEVESIVPENATLAQIYRVAAVLKQDMANRHRTLDEGLNEIRQRVGGGRGGGQHPQSARPPIVQHSPSSGQYRYSLDGGQTWLPGQPPQ